MQTARNLRSFVLFTLTLGAITACTTVAAARWHWAGELASSFRWQLGGAGLVSAALLLLLRARRHALLFCALSGWLLWPGGSLYVPRFRAPVDGAALRVATINVLASNRDGERVRGWIRAEDPDVVAVQEVGLFWLQELRKLEDRWPYRLTTVADERQIHEQTFTMALLSKRALRLVECLGEERRGGGIVAELELEGRAVRVVIAHPGRPGRRGLVPRRNQILAQVAERAAAADAAGAACVVLGDLNTSSGSPAFARLLRDGRLGDSRRGFGRQPTWRMERPIPGVWVDIDHVLVNDSFDVADRRRGPDTGSDHRPVAADLILRPTTPN
ncbi:MAG: endonuclease/exonuclease/phosphatase family protein [Planctomycetota bacterium]